MSHEAQIKFQLEINLIDKYVNLETNISGVISDKHLSDIQNYAFEKYNRNILMEELIRRAGVPSSLL